MSTAAPSPTRCSAASDSTSTRSAREIMSRWVRWAAPPAIVVSIAAPAHAVRYLSVEQAQKVAFPDATRFVEAHVIFTPADVASIERRSGQKVRARGQQVWRALVD